MELRDWIQGLQGSNSPRRLRNVSDEQPLRHDDNRPSTFTAPVLLVCGLLTLGCVAILDFGVIPPPLSEGEKAPFDYNSRVKFHYQDFKWAELERSRVASETPPVFRAKANWSESVLRDLRMLAQIVIDANTEDEAKAAAMAAFSNERTLVSELYDFKTRRGAQALSNFMSNLEQYIEGLRRKGVVNQPEFVHLKLLNPDGPVLLRAEPLPNGQLILPSNADDDENQPSDAGVNAAMQAALNTTEVKSVPYTLEESLEGLLKYMQYERVPDVLLGRMGTYFKERLGPTLVYDETATKLKRAQVTRSISTFRIFRRGERLLAKDTYINDENLKVLIEEARAYKAGLSLQTRVFRWAGYASMCIGILFIFLMGVRRTEPHVLRRSRPLLMLGVTCLFILAISKGLMLNLLPGTLAPVCFATVVASLAFSQNVAILTSLCLSVLVGLAAGGNLPLMLALMVGGIVAALPAEKLQSRWDILKYGTLGGLCQGLALAGIALLASAGGFSVDTGGATSMFSYQQTSMWDGLYGLVNGIFCGLLLLGSLPLIETIFGIITNIRLFELCDQNQPAIKKIQLEAPGTWAHTLQVAFLSEPAAEAIGANARLVRTGVYYHDLGKVLKPEYFIENNQNAGDLHKKLSPSVSSLIITSHVKDGVQLALEYGLPRQIVDFIPEHHGTTLVEYFYHSARKRADAKELRGAERVQEGLFRYPGPKPQSRETAIVMLADTVEAATRTLESPTATRLRSFVHELIMKKLLDNQLDESDLTFRDIAIIEDIFLRVLISRFHSRVRYPEQEDGGGSPTPATMPMAAVSEHTPVPVSAPAASASIKPIAEAIPTPVPPARAVSEALGVQRSIIPPSQLN